MRRQTGSSECELQIVTRKRKCTRSDFGQKPTENENKKEMKNELTVCVCVCDW